MLSRPKEGFIIGFVQKHGYFPLLPPVDSALQSKLLVQEKLHALALRGR